VIATAISTNRGIATDASRYVAGCRVRTAVPVADTAAMQTSADVRITPELRASSFVGGHVWLRPATLDVLVPTTQGHLAWSPPT
jgi:hypothetical protein